MLPSVCTIRLDGAALADGRVKSRDAHVADIDLDEAAVFTQTSSQAQ